MNTINIFIECIKTPVFSRVRSRSENLNVFIIQDENIYGIYVNKIIVYCFSTADVIADVAKQNRNIMTSTLSAYHKEREKQNQFDTRMFLIF